VKFDTHQTYRQDEIMSKETGTQGTFERSAAICMAVVCAISLLAAAGWLFNKPTLASLNPKFIPMPPATAIIFLGLCGAWLFQRIFPDMRWIRTLVQATLVGMLIIVINLALRYFTGLGLDLEKLLYPAPPLFGQFSSARMSPLSAMGFFLAFPAFLLLTGGKPGQNIRSVSAALSLVLFVLSSLVLIGYLFKAPPFYGGTLIPMSITSGISFWFLSLELLLMAGPDIWPVRMYVGSSLRARLMRVFIPISILIALFQGLLSTADDPWIGNPTIKVAVAAFVACLIILFIIYLLAKNLSSEFDRGRKAEQALLQSEAKLRALFAGMVDVVFVLDIDGRYIEIAPTNPTNLYRPPDEMLGKTMHDILPKEQADYILSMIRGSIQNGQVVSYEYTLQIDGKEIYFTATASRLSETTAIMVAHNITERKLMEEEIHSLSLTDELTGLYNRRGFTLLAEQEMKLAHREKRSMLLFFGDVNDLKVINDNLGHAQGDLALQEVSAILKETFRDADILARFGGDEFLVLAVDASVENADVLTNRIQSFLERGNQQGDWPYQLSLSLGIAHYDPEAPCTVSELIAQADGRMYRQKQARKGKQ
jgi:diguanylate cyclase (GGDEF)-like protein/PAS domain S-box-containing protein